MVVNGHYLVVRNSGDAYTIRHLDTRHWGRFRIAVLLCVGLGLSCASTRVWAEDTDLATKADALVKKSDCLTCHRVDQQILGPSYREVAERYRGDASAVDTLVQKVIEGGQGKWGPIPMLPHPTLSKEDADLIVRWILSLE